MLGKLGLNKFYIFLLSIFSLLLFMGIFKHPIVYLTLIINFCVLLKGDIKYIFGQLFFLLPFAMIYKISPSSSSFYTYLMIASAIYFLFSKKLNLYLLIPIAIYLLIGGLTSLSGWLKMIMGFILLLSFIKNADLNLFKIVIVSFSIGLVISSIIGTFKLDIPQLSVFYSDFNEEYIGGVKTIRFSGLYQDPNFFSISIIMSIFLMISLIIRKIIPLTYGAIIVSMLTYFGFLTYSKMYVLALVLVLITQLSSFVLRSKFKFIGIIGGCIFLIIIAYLFLSSTYFDAFSTRLDTDDISNNRFLIWGYYIDYLLANVFTFMFGAGLDAPLINNVETHNTYIESLYKLGIFGSFLYLYTIKLIFNTRRCIKSVKYKDYVLLFIFAIMISTLHALSVHDFIFYIILIWISLSLSYYENSPTTYKNGVRRH